jgi:type IV secretory pathway TraG/TraD family ATPase VirD4
MQWLHNGNCDGCKTFTFETPSSAHVYIGFKEYSSMVQSIDHSIILPTEKLFLWYKFIRLWNSSCGRNSQCVFILIKFVTSNHFISRFQNFFERENMKRIVLSWWKKNAALKHTNHFVFKFSQRDFSTSTSVVFYIFWCGIWGAHSGKDS